MYSEKLELLRTSYFAIKGTFPLFGQNDVVNVDEFQRRIKAFPENLSLQSQLVPKNLQNLRCKITTIFHPSYASFLLLNSLALETKFWPKKRR